jgi:hypothetical protein
MPLIALVATTLVTIVYHDYNHEGHSSKPNETHGNLVKCHMSQF